MREIEEREFGSALEEIKRSIRDSADDESDSYYFNQHVSSTNPIFSQLLDPRDLQNRTSSAINDDGDEAVIEEETYV